MDPTFNPADEDREHSSTDHLVGNIPAGNEFEGNHPYDAFADNMDDDAQATARPENDVETHGYDRVMRTVALLTREEEEALGKTIRDSRLSMTHTLSKVPAASTVLITRIAEIERGERLLTDVFFAPLESGDTCGIQLDDGAEDAARATSRLVWRETGAALNRRYEEWRTANGETRRRDAEIRLALAFRRLEPGFFVLREALEACEALDARVSTIEAAHGMFHADLLVPHYEPEGQSTVETEHNNLKRAREELRRLKAEAGVDLTTLRACCRTATATYGAYRRARLRMVTANLRLAHLLAHKLAGNGVAVEDLVQEAIFGLMRAVDKFDHRLGYKFSTYASQWIRQATNRAIADGSRTVRVAAHMHDKLVSLRKIGRQLEQRLGREATPVELAEESGLTPARVRQALEASRVPKSLDAPVPGLEDSTLYAYLDDPAPVDPSDASNDARLTERIARLLDTLPPRDAFILRMRHGIGVREARTLEDIGAMLGITRERARQIEGRAVAKLRQRLNPAVWTSK